jgi:hypothetical protein
MDMAKIYNPSQTTPRSGQHEIRGPRGGHAGKGRSSGGSSAKYSEDLIEPRAAGGGAVKSPHADRNSAVEPPRPKAIERAKALAPAEVIPAKPSPRHADTIVTKSGRTIFVSPAKSATTIEDWSKAFKK